MVKLLFVCYGNICRSPMAEFIMKDMVKKSGLESCFEIASAAVSTEEIGNPVYPPAKEELAKHKIKCDGKTARQMTKLDYDNYDFIIGMDNSNIREMRKIAGGDKFGKIYRLLDFTEQPGEVSDPWYHRNFTKCYNEIKAGCEDLMMHLINEGLIY
ncbi:MAG: low molecular weight protein-tyrosine-phosphatase [Clostridia bacterium]|nr:low molecular weight protein-tyrosine-phosphatase [Clostridia bacterium]